MLDYSPEVQKLFELGECDFGEDWLDYAAHGIGPQHIPELVQLACTDQYYSDDESDLRCWAPTHARRALGQLRAVQALGPLFSVLDREWDAGNDLFSEDLGTIIPMMGRAALVEILGLFDLTFSEMVRVRMAECLANLAKADPEVRAPAIEVICGELEETELSTPEEKGLFIASLLDMKAVEALPLIERLYEEGLVDDWICGRIEHVRWDLGVGPEPPPYRRTRVSEPPASWHLQWHSADSHSSQQKAKAKAKRKAARVARKRNRRK
jgi:hypothetical protein